MKSNEKYISEARANCKTQSDHEFVDAWANIMTEFEKPRKPIDPFENMFMTHEMREEWDNAIKYYMNTHAYTVESK